MEFNGPKLGIESRRTYSNVIFSREHGVTVYQALSTQELSPCCPPIFSPIMFALSTQHRVHFLLSLPDWPNGSSEIRGVNPLECTVPRLSQGNVAGGQIQLSRPVWGPKCRPNTEQDKGAITDRNIITCDF